MRKAKYQTMVYIIQFIEIFWFMHAPIFIIMTDSNSSGQGKLYFRAKVGDLMQQYERSKQEQQQHKQQLKQNIMQQIMNNRQKTQPQLNTLKSQSQNKSHTSNTANTDPPLQQMYNLPAPIDLRTGKFNQVEVKPGLISEPLSVQRSKVHDKKPIQSEQNQFAEITFNKNRNKSMEEEMRQKPTILPSSKTQNQINAQENKSINSMSRYANKYLPQILSQSQGRNFQQYPKEVMMQSSVRSKVEDTQPLDNKYSYKKNSMLLLKHQMEREPEDEKQEDQEYNQVAQDLNNQEPNGVFLTMDESESMTASQLPKNCAYQIKMEKQVDPDLLEQLKVQKIKQMQRKRQERIQQFRRNQSQKKVEMPRGRNNSKRHQKTQRQQQSVTPPKTTTIQRKSNMQRPPKLQNKSERQPHPNKNQLIPLQSHESQYQVRQNNGRPNSNYFNKQQQLKRSKQTAYMQQQQPPHKPVSPFRTPKTVLSQNRQKSSSKNSNIFYGQGNPPRQKSCNKASQPKIQPKQRKNSFSRQSNKKLMINAITHVCFPGQLNRKERERWVQVLQTSQYEFFVFLFKQYSRKIVKGIYTLDSTQTRLDRIYGDKSPPQIASNQVQEFYRFDSGSREFKKVDGCRSFSLAIHAVDLR